jgi:hypothetical protein
MNPRLLFLTFFFLGLFFQNTFAQTELVLIFTDNTESSTSVSNISRITFQENNLVLKLNSGTSTDYPVVSIDRMVFSGDSDTETETIQTTDITVYPNPASDYLTIRNLPASYTQVTIYQSSGVVVYSAKMNSGNNQLDVSTFPKGIYIIKADGKTLKFSKF